MRVEDDNFPFENVISAMLQLHCWREFCAGDPQGWPAPIHLGIVVVRDNLVADAETTPSICCILQGAGCAQYLRHESLPACLAVPTNGENSTSDLGTLVARAYAGSESYADLVSVQMQRQGTIELALFSFRCIPIRDAIGTVLGVMISCSEVVPASFREHAIAAADESSDGSLTPQVNLSGTAENSGSFAEAKRRESDQHRYLFDNMTEGFALIDSAWRISQINAEGLRLANRRRDEVIGYDFWEVWPEMRGTQVETEMMQVMAHGQSVNLEHVLTFAPCDQRWYDIRIYPALHGGLALFCRDITPRRETENALRAAELSSRNSSHYLRLLLDTMTEGLYALDREMNLTLCNAAFCRMLGLSATDELLGQHLHERIHHSYPDGSPYHRDDCRIYRAAREGSSDYVDDEFFFRADGSSFPVEYRVRPIFQDGELFGTMCTFSDVTERKRADRALKESEQRFRSLFAHHIDAILAARLDGAFTESNSMMQELTGYSEAELQTMRIGSLAREEDVEIAKANFSLATIGTSQKIQTSICRKDDRILRVEATYIPIIVDAKVIGIFVVIRDITAATDYERHIRYLASHDALTGLPNRNLLDDRLRHAIFKRGKHQVGVLFLDLNRFKMINDSLGHDKGDLLLKIVADRMKIALRQGDTIARLGGDEFVVVLEEIESIEQIAAISHKLLAEVEQLINLEGHEVSISTSIGIAVYPKDGADADTLLKHADLAMYQAKNAGSGTFRFFSPEMNIKTLERLLNETGLRRVIDRNELVVHYQPRIDVSRGTTVGVEALVRWQHPDRGMIAPNDFIPLAEEIGMISLIGEWVLQAACRQNRAWQDAGLPQTKVSINLSAHQLLSPLFADTLERIVHDSGLDVKWLELEITETSLMENIEASLDTLRRIQAMGISMSIDDFGTGYSSLSYLRKLPVDTLKIDQSFMRDLLEHPDDAVIVAATIGLAHSMGLHVVAEGVATIKQAQFLLQKDCTTMQGFLFSRPLSAVQCGLFLARGNVLECEGLM